MEILQGTFLQGMKKWRAHAISSTSPEAAYYNLGAFSQSVRLGLTHATLQHQRVLCRLNSWLSMLFPLGTWSSICISHNELLRLHHSTNEPNTLNYTVTLGPFTGGGLLLESASGGHCHFVEVITAYTCRNLDKMQDSDVQALRSWGFPLPLTDTLLSSVASSRLSASLELPSKFCLWLGSLAPSARDMLASKSVPLIPVLDLGDIKLRKQILRCAAEGVLSTVFIRFSEKWTAEHNGWVLQLCKLAFSCGTTVHLDISAWDRCWYDPPLFIHCVATGFRHVVQIPPCAFQGSEGRPWIMVSSSEAFASLGEVCTCKQSIHVSGTPEYPVPLVEAFGKLFLSVDGVAGVHDVTFSVQDAWNAIPCKSVDDPPHAWVDGGGLHSRPDWSGKEREGKNIMRDLRHALMSFCGDSHLPSRLRSRLLSPSETSIFSSEDISQLQCIFGDWLRAHDCSEVDWSIPVDQPYCLRALSALSTSLHDCDMSLFGAFLQGVPTGFKRDIPLSGCFAPSCRAVEEDSLSISMENWQGAEADPLLLEELIQIEVDSGWLRCIDSLEDARKIWPNVAVGKLNIVHSAGRKPRLVVDSSICGTNSACLIPERTSLPTLQSVQCSWPLRGRHEPVAAWSIDVKSAHKSRRVRESEQGLLGVRVGPKFFFYKVCPFGAAFSAFWFARLGAFFVRALHRLIYISHFLALYVDDFLGYQSATVAEMSLCITLCFCGAFGIPLCWKKLQFGCCIRWIGWELDFDMGCVSIPTDKLQKLAECISLALRGKYTDRQTLSKICGMLQWLFKLFPLAKPWSRALYQDLRTPRATNFSLRQGDWQCFVECLSNTLHLVRLPPGGARSIGSRVLAVRHRKVHSKKELLNCNLGDKDIWLRISDPASKRRALSHASRDLLHFWLGWAKLPPLWRSLRPQQPLQVEAAADAMGNGSTFAIGGYITFPSGEFWFSECFSVSDFAFADLPLKSEAHKDISCYECLGQIALVWLLSTLHPMCRLSLKLRTWCDNSGAESASNKMFTTSWPFAAFVQRLALLSSFTGIHLDVQHIPGDKNVEADYLSRWKPPAFQVAAIVSTTIYIATALGSSTPAGHFSEVVEAFFSASELLHSWGSFVALAVFSSESHVFIWRNCCATHFHSLPDFSLGKKHADPLIAPTKSVDHYIPMDRIPGSENEVMSECERVCASIPFIHFPMLLHLDYIEYNPFISCSTCGSCEYINRTGA